MASSAVRYLVFDTESIADGDLVSQIRYPEDELDGDEAVQRYREEMLEKYETDFIPYTYQIPVAVAAAKVDKSHRLIDLVALDEPEYRPHVITENFWRGWQAYRKPTLVSFNGRTFDLPLLELAAFRYGIGVPEWFNLSEKSYEQRRNRYNLRSHLDLQDVFTNFGASRFNGGLNLAANILGKPGKMEIVGHMVQDLYADGEISRINDYCRCDVLDTYFIFLRVQVMRGELSLDAEQDLIDTTRQWLEQRTKECSVYEEYLAGWGDWTNPWKESGRRATAQVS